MREQKTQDDDMIEHLETLAQQKREQIKSDRLTARLILGAAALVIILICCLLVMDSHDMDISMPKKPLNSLNRARF